MKKIILFVAILTLAVFVTGVMAQPKPAEKPAPAPVEKPKMEKPKMEKFSGMIDKVDDMAKTVDVKGKVKKEEKTMTFATDADTKVTRGKETLSVSDLKKGMNASVEYKKEGDKMTATAIKLAAPKAAPKKEKPAAEPKK